MIRARQKYSQVRGRGIAVAVLAVFGASNAAAQSGLGKVERALVAAVDYVVNSRPELSTALVSSRLACLPATDCVGRWRIDSTLSGLAREPVVGIRQLRVTDPKVSGNCPPHRELPTCGPRDQAPVLGLIDAVELTAGRFRMRLAEFLPGDDATPRIRYLEVSHFSSSDRYVVTRESVAID